MTRANILLWLSVTAPILALVSGLISQTQKTADTDESGRKRLTGAGRTLMGLSIVSAGIAVLALGFGELNKKDADAEAARTKLQETQDKTLGLQIAADSKVAGMEREQREVLDDLQRASEQQAQRLILLSEFAAAQRRDAQLSLQLAREASERLAVAERTFSEFERVNNPLRKIEVYARVSIKLTDPTRASRFWKDLDDRTDLSVEINARDRSRGREAFFRPDQLQGRNDGYALYAILARRPQLLIADLGKARPFKRDTLVPVEPEFLPRRREIIKISLEPDYGRAAFKHQIIAMTYKGVWQPSEEGVVENGSKLSSADFRKLGAVLGINSGNRSASSATLINVDVRVNDLFWFEAPAHEDSTDLVLGERNQFSLHPSEHRK